VTERKTLYSATAFKQGEDKMKKAFVLALLITSVVVFWGCSGGPKIEPRSIATVKSDILTKTDDVNAYLSAHDLVNTKPEVLAKQLVIFSQEYGALAAEANKMMQKNNDPALNELLALANEGVANTNSLSEALAGDPDKNPTAFAALQTATAAWAQYTDKSIQMATGAAPEATATAPPQGTATAPPAESTATTPTEPGKGHHYGWWKNPAWANDPASRGTTASPPGEGSGVQTKGQDRVQDQDKEKHREKEKQQIGGGQPAGKGAGHAGKSGKSADTE
jgi:hypothetical protein